MRMALGYCFPSVIKFLIDLKNTECKPECWCSVIKLCLTFCNPMDCSMPGFLSLTISWSLPKFMSIKSMMPSNHLILCHPLVFLPSISPSIRVFYKDIIVIIATIVTSHRLLNFLSSVSQCVQRLHTSKLTTCLLLNQVLGTLLQKTESESLKVNPRNLKINKLSLDISKS